MSLAAGAAEPLLVDVRTERIDAPGWRVRGLHAGVELADDGLRGAVRIERIELPDAGLDLADTLLECGDVQLGSRWFRCRDAVVNVELPAVGRLRIAGRFDYERDAGVLHAEIPALALAGGTIALRGRFGETASDLVFDGDGLEIASLVRIAALLGVAPAELAAGGLADVRGTLRTAAAGGLALELDANLDGASLANDEGTLVGEALGGTVHLAAIRADTWRFDLELAAGRGEAYVEPVYANLAEHAIRIRLEDVRTADFTTVHVGRFELEQASQAALAGTARLTLPSGEEPLAIESATITITDTAIDALYANVLQIAFAGTVLGDLETAGRVEGTVTMASDALESADLDLTDVILDDRRRRWAIYGLNGSVHWPGPGGTPNDARASRLEWGSASGHGILVGAGAMLLALGGDDVVLLDPLRLPTMGGALRVNRLEVHDYGTDQARALLDAELEPIQLGQLTGAFGWPAFSGTLSGRLPLMTYEGNAMTVGGRLTARAFDGDIELANLAIRQPFGRVPRLSGELTMRNLDLERLTNTFSFGLIQGRLSGDVTGLQLAAWRPVAMDAHLYSTPGSRTPRRISQRAVENLASVGGGGAGAALSSGFLKFFEVFAYEEIGLRCVLTDGVCSMSGAGPAGEGPYGRGYYIVRGRGIPRIDVIGYRERVGWEALLKQLEAITRDGAPVVR